MSKSVASSPNPFGNQKFMKTMTLSPGDYGGRPRTAASQSNESYFGGFFNTHANFQRQIDE